MIKPQVCLTVFFDMPILYVLISGHVWKFINQKYISYGREGNLTIIRTIIMKILTVIRLALT